MPVIRTPDERFSILPDFPFAPHYIEVNGLRIHYVDEGKGETILCLHGEPSWSFLYRKMIAAMSRKHRVVAMDFIGFGRSDKFTEREAYSFGMHLGTLMGFIKAMDLKHITVVVQDWGGLIGLAAVAHMPERFARLVIMRIPACPLVRASPAKLFWPGAGMPRPIPTCRSGSPYSAAWLTLRRLPKKSLPPTKRRFPTLDTKPGLRCGRSSSPSALMTPLPLKCGMPGRSCRSGTSRPWSCSPIKTLLQAAVTSSSALSYPRPKTSRRLSSRTPVTSFRKRKARKYLSIYWTS